MYIYAVIIIHNGRFRFLPSISSLSLSVLANGRSQFLLDRLWRCLKLFVRLTAHPVTSARVCVCACMCVRVCACVMCLQYKIIIFLPRLIMIIIKIIFLYFIEIAHTDDFPSTGNRLVYNNY